MVNISVIIPVYKTPIVYLRACLESLVTQTMRDCEFIVVSDGAPEEECSLCEEFAVKDSRFKFFRKEHAGVSVARNFGIKKSSGKYIAFVDADDWISNDILEKAWHISVQHDCDICFWNCIISKDNYSYAIKYKHPDKTLLSPQDIRIVKENLFFISQKQFLLFVYPVCKLYKATLIQDVRFLESLEIGEDRIFNLEIIDDALKIVYLNINGYFYRQINSSATKKYRSNAFETLCRYIQEMARLSNGKYESDISDEIFFKFDESLATDFFHPQNPYPLSHNLQRIQKIFYSADFQEKISKCDLSKLGIFNKISHFFISRKIFFWIYIRYIMKRISNLVK